MDHSGADRCWFGPIFRIADDRMADGFGMGAKLVRAPGNRLHREPGEPRHNLIDGGVIGHRMLRIFVAMLGDPHFFARRASPLRSASRGHRPCPRPWRDRAKYAPAPAWHAFDQCPIDLAGLTRAKNLAEIGRDLARPGDQQHARCIAVEAMNQTGRSPRSLAARPACRRYGAWCRSRPARRGRRAC